MVHHIWSVSVWIFFTISRLRLRVFPCFGDGSMNMTIAGKSTMNESMYFLLNMGDFPASHVSFHGCMIILYYFRMLIFETRDKGVIQIRCVRLPKRFRR